jgi:hypothetical protein
VLYPHIRIDGWSLRLLNDPDPRNPTVSFSARTSPGRSARGAFRPRRSPTRAQPAGEGCLIGHPSLMFINDGLGRPSGTRPSSVLGTGVVGKGGHHRGRLRSLAAVTRSTPHAVHHSMNSGTSIRRWPVSHLCTHVRGRPIFKANSRRVISPRSCRSTATNAT